MSVLVDEDETGQVTTRRRRPTRVRRRTGEPRRPPARVRVVADRRRRPVADCGPRRVPPRWPWLVAVGIAVAMAVAGLAVLAAGVSGGVPGHTATVPVGQGQSLWDLARQYAPDSDPASVVARIRQLNGLEDAVPVPGQALTVPIAAAEVPAPP